MELTNLLKSAGVPFRSFPEEDWDILNEEAGKKILSSGECKILVNCAAYTAVDAAEANREAAFRVNEEAPALLKKLAGEAGAFYIHISTDFVFNGLPDTGRLRPWKVSDVPNPVGVYGESKRAGEISVVNENKKKGLPDFQGLGLIRTSWVYSAGGANFPKTILRLLKDPAREKLTIIEDQIGRPTWTYRLAEFIYRYAMHKGLVDGNHNFGEGCGTKQGELLHFSNEGVASWYDLAVAVQSIGHELGLLTGTVKPILPIPTEAYPTPAPRPSYSVMDLSESRKIMPVIPHWLDDLKEAMGVLKNMPQV